MDFLFNVDLDKKEGAFLVYIQEADWNTKVQFQSNQYFKRDVTQQCFVGSIGSDTVSFLERYDFIWSPAANEARKYVKVRELFFERAARIKEHFLKTGELLDEGDTLKDVPFKTQPYVHQKVALCTAINQPGIALLMEMGTGKTKVSIDRACYELWKSEHGWYRMVVVAPKSILDNWEQEFETHCWLPYHTKVLRGSTNAKADEIMATFVPEALEMQKEHKKVLSVVIVNYEALDKLRYLIGVLRPNLAVFDETTQVKNPSAVRTKAALDVRDACNAGMILNGTAISKSPLDLWSQFELAERGMLGYKTFNSFRSRYSFAVDRYRSEIQNIPELKAKIAQASFIITKKDCLDLPERVYIRRNIEMSKQQKLAYRQLKEELIIELNAYKETHREDNPAIVAQHILTQMLRLEQITSGFIQDKSQQLKHHFTPNPKTDELNQLLETEEGKVIVWCRFVENIKHLQQSLNGSCVVLYGEVPTHERQSIVNEFNTSNEKRVVIAHPQVAGFGLNILGTEEQPVNTVVRYSHDFNYAWVKQSDDRCHRLGMHSSKLTYVDLVVPNTIDTYILKNLAQKEAVANEFKNASEMLEVQDLDTLFGEI